MTASLIRTGDLLQSSASRLAEFVLALCDSPQVAFVPYEVHMAALEAQAAVDEWTRCRTNTPKA